uniref:C2 domain-containing protein n=1 Tax=Spongospora subterranea TaxID=70186 RepID=A0A0H5RAY5_9EUKA|eukprot:CRZ05634.1 hypothetical protein [Spongospora subterranea]
MSAKSDQFSQQYIPMGQSSLNRYPLYCCDVPDYSVRDSYLLAQFSIVPAHDRVPPSKQTESRNSKTSLRTVSIVVQSIGIRGVKNVTTPLSSPSLELSFPDFTPGCKSPYIVKSVEPDSASQTTNAANFSKTIRFDSVLIPICDIDSCPLLVKLFDGRLLIGHRYIDIGSIWSVQGKDGEFTLSDMSIGQSQTSPDSPWYVYSQQPQLTSSVQTLFKEKEKSANLHSEGESIALNIDSLNVDVSPRYKCHKENVNVKAFVEGDASPLSTSTQGPLSAVADLDQYLCESWKTADAVQKLILYGGRDDICQVDPTLLSKPSIPNVEVAHLKAIIMAGEVELIGSYRTAPDLSELQSATYAVRVYIYRGLSFPPRSTWFAHDRRIHPYLIIHNGDDPDHHIDDRASSDVIECDSLNPEFARTFQLSCRFPDNGELNITVMNKDPMLGKDTAIGHTVIDLEQRLLNPIYRHLPASQRREYRHLVTASSRLAQGKLDLRLDIIPWHQASSVPMEQLIRPEPEPYEIRLVIWATRDIRFPSDDRFDTIDQTITCTVNFTGEPGADTITSTDTAWGSGAEADWNYRMMFPVVLPCRVPRLKMTVWDSDIFGRTTIGDVIVNLSGMMSEAWRDRRRIVHVPSRWLAIEHPDAVGKDVGEINIELWAVAREEADGSPVGEGQNAPNRDPYLPAPSRKPPPWAVGSRLLNTLELFGRRKNLLVMLCCILVAFPLLVPLVLGKITSI